MTIDSFIYTYYDITQDACIEKKSINMSDKLQTTEYTVKPESFGKKTLSIEMRNSLINN